MARIGRPSKPLSVSPETRGELESLAGSRSLPMGLVRRAKIVLLYDDGLTRNEPYRVFRRLSYVSPATVAGVCWLRS